MALKSPSGAERPHPPRKHKVLSERCSAEPGLVGDQTCLAPSGNRTWTVPKLHHRSTWRRHQRRRPQTCSRCQLHQAGRWSMCPATSVSYKKIVKHVGRIHGVAS